MTSILNEIDLLLIWLIKQKSPICIFIRIGQIYRINLD